jgi:hypothetical protein
MCVPKRTAIYIAAASIIPAAVGLLHSSQVQADQGQQMSTDVAYSGSEARYRPMPYSGSEARYRPAPAANEMAHQILPGEQTTHQAAAQVDSE